MSQVPVSEEVYYRDKYWNDHQLIIAYLCRLLRYGRPGEVAWWPWHFVQHYLKDGPFHRALFLNCGNGWVERELYDLGVFRSGIGFDYSQELLKQARAEAGSRPVHYFKADCNKVEFAEGQFDLVFNVAAMHHVQFIDRLHRIIARTLKPGGFYVSFDYIGPHRNQYGRKHFEEIVNVNKLLPVGLRKEPLDHPHLESMLQHDPTEAIHSELILKCFERYFVPVERIDLNGPVAYQIMHNNQELFYENLEISNAAVNFLVDMDELYARVAGLAPFFSFFVGQPRKSVLEDRELLEQLTREEQTREEYAAQHQERYDYQIELP